MVGIDKFKGRSGMKRRMKERSAEEMMKASAFIFYPYSFNRSVSHKNFNDLNSDGRKVRSLSKKTIYRSFTSKVDV